MSDFDKKNYRWPALGGVGCVCVCSRAHVVCVCLCCEGGNQGQSPGGNTEQQKAKPVFFSLLSLDCLLKASKNTSL